MADEDRPRRRKGKEPMTKEQLKKEDEEKRLREEEDRRRRIEERLKKEIGYRKRAEKTQLSEMIRKMLESVAPSDTFSWPTIDPSLLPSPMDQQKLELCIAFATYHLLQMHANIIATRRGITRPVISLDYLKQVLESLSPEEQTLEVFLGILHDKGVPSQSAFREKLERPREDIKFEFGIDWSYGISPEGLSHDQLKEYIKYAIKNYGGVLLEYKKYSKKMDGKRKLIMIEMAGEKKAKTARKAKKATEVEESKRPLGHVVVTYGWGSDNDGKEEFYCLNSYGTGFGNRGSCTLKQMGVDLDDIHFVYVVQLRFL